MSDDDFDVERVKKLRLLFEDKYEQAVSDFLENAKSYLNALYTAIKQHNDKEATEVAHKLRSSTGLFGLVKVYKLVTRIEYELSSLDADARNKLIKELKTAFRKGEKQLKAGDA